MSIDDERKHIMDIFAALEKRVDHIDEQAQALSTVPGRLEAIEERQMKSAENLKKNTEVTEGIARDTADLIETFKALQGGFKVLQWLGKASIPIGIAWGGIKLWAMGVFTGGVKP